MRSVPYIPCALALVLCSFVSCRRPSVDLNGKGCDTAGRCAPGYVCYPPTFACVRELPASCDGTGTCPSEVVTGGACSEIGSVLPCSTTVPGCDAGCRRCEEDGRWSGCGGSVPAPSGDPGPSGPTGPSNAAEDPRVTTLVATSGDDATTTLAFTVPSGAVACTLRRTTGSVATSAADGTAVGSEVSAEPVSVKDIGLTNGTTYFYTAFCRSGASYRSVSVTLGENAAQAVPIGIAQDLTATVSSGPTVTLSFTKPSGAVGCQLRRNVGSPPTLTTGTAIGAEQTTSSANVSDSGVVNGTTYLYAAFCRVDLYRNETTTSGENLVSAVVSAACVGTFTVSKSTPQPGDPKQCAPITAGKNNNIVARLTMVSGNCPSHLTGLAVGVHPQSNTDFVNVKRIDPSAARFGEDEDGDGLLSNGEVIMAGVVTDQTLTFAGFSHAFAANESKRFIVEVDARVSAGAIEAGFFAAQVSSTDDVRLQEPSMTRALSPTPLVFDAHAVTKSTCDSKPFSRMISVMSFEMAPVSPLNLIAPDLLLTPSAVDDYCNTFDARCDLDGVATSNCRANDVVDDLALRTDALGVTGSTGVTRYLKIATGLPYGLPVCRVALEVQASLHAGGNACDPKGGLFHWSGVTLPPETHEAPLHYFYKYQDATQVVGPIGSFIDVRNPPIFTAATTTSGMGSSECMHMQVTHNLTTLYMGPSLGSVDAALDFDVRMFADDSVGLNDAATSSVRNASEVHLLIDEP